MWSASDWPSRFRILPMPRHASVTNEYIAMLDRGFDAALDKTKAAPYSEVGDREDHVCSFYETALERVKAGWSKERIECELRPALVAYKLGASAATLAEFVGRSKSRSERPP
jgi:hypothetical protein